MGDTARQNAHARRAAILAEIKTLKKELVSIDDFLLSWAAFAGEAPPARKVRVKAQTRRTVVADAVCDILREKGAPMKIGDILSGLSANNIEIGGAKPVETLRTMLWRSQNRVVKTHDGYWLQESTHD